MRLTNYAGVHASDCDSQNVNFDGLRNDINGSAIYIGRAGDVCDRPASIKVFLVCCFGGFATVSRTH